MWKCSRSIVVESSIQQRPHRFLWSLQDPAGSAGLQSVAVMVPKKTAGFIQLSIRKNDGVAHPTGFPIQFDFKMDEYRKTLLSRLVVTIFPCCPIKLGFIPRKRWTSSRKSGILPCFETWISIFRISPGVGLRCKGGKHIPVKQHNKSYQYRRPYREQSDSTGQWWNSFFSSVNRRYRPYWIITEFITES